MILIFVSIYRNLHAKHQDVNYTFDVGEAEKFPPDGVTEFVVTKPSSWVVLRQNLWHLPIEDLIRAVLLPPVYALDNCFEVRQFIDQESRSSTF